MNRGNGLGAMLHQHHFTALALPCLSWLERDCHTPTVNSKQEEEEDNDDDEVDDTRLVFVCITSFHSIPFHSSVVFGFWLFGSW